MQQESAEQSGEEKPGKKIRSHTDPKLTFFITILGLQSRPPRWHSVHSGATRGSQTRKLLWRLAVSQQDTAVHHRPSQNQECDDQFLGLLVDVAHVLLCHGLWQPSALQVDVPPKKRQRRLFLSPKQRRQRQGDSWGFWTDTLARMISSRFSEKLCLKK